MTIRSRRDLSRCQRVVIKAGTSVVCEGGHLCISRMGGIVEQIAALRRQNRDVLFVTSGSVAVGRRILRTQELLNTNMRDFIHTASGHHSTPSGGASGSNGGGYHAASAAAGQLGLMSLYSTLFSSVDVATSQLLLTGDDFASPERRRNVQDVISSLLEASIVPVINENDAVSANQGYTPQGVFSDNDSLASIIAREIDADLLILLTDVEGVYTAHPNDPSASLFNYITRDTQLSIGAKSAQGRGGMQAKIDAAFAAVEGGVRAAVVASGKAGGNAITRVIEGELEGTLVLAQAPLDPADGAAASANGGQAYSPPQKVQAAYDTAGKPDTEGKATEVAEDQEKERGDLRRIAESARQAGRALAAMPRTTRVAILNALAEDLLTREEEVLQANLKDMEAAEGRGVAAPLLKRLAVTSTKLHTLAEGVRTLAQIPDPVGRVLERTELSPHLVLDKTTCPIGNLLVIFESRPESLIQIAALSLCAGNGLLLKGGREAENSNTVLHEIVAGAIRRVCDDAAVSLAVSLVRTRTDVAELLKLDDVLDLVIPRGSGEMVQRIKQSTKIPVLGHAEGVCHVYIDASANVDTAVAVAVDSKINYPAACNAAETLLLHVDTTRTTSSANATATTVLDALIGAGVTLKPGPRAHAIGLIPAATGGAAHPAAVADMRTEYGDMIMSVEVVDDVAGAVQHIHSYGSAHTDTIVCEDQATAETFLTSVDSACVFHNASTRFADGGRFGMGGEVGISTGRIHARGPVGVEGLLTTKYKLRSTAPAGHAVSDFSGPLGVIPSTGQEREEQRFSHRPLPVS